MMPKRRYMDGNKGTEAPSSFLFFDTESYSHVSPHDPDVTRLSLRLWCATALRLEAGKVTRREERRGTDASSFWAFVASRQSRDRVLWCFAHNLGHDLTQVGFWARLDEREYSIGPIDRGVSARTGKPLKPWTGRLCLESKPTFVIVMGQRGKVRFVDTVNYWPVPLATLGKAYGLDKMTMPPFRADDEDWFTYCRRDVEVCERAVIDLVLRWTRTNSGVFRMTAPGLAYQNFKHICPVRVPGRDKVDIVLEKESEARPLERDAYYGGRIEPFFIGRMMGPIYHVDCNSLYPAMMASSLFPRARVDSFRNIRPERLRRLMSNYGAVARVKIESHTDTYVVRRKGVQLHCSGFFWTSLCGPELKRALDNGHVTEVSEAHTYAMADLFSKWVYQWYERKLEAREKGDRGKGDYEFCNLILKSISGRFAMRSDYWADRLDIHPRGRWGHWFKLPRDKGDISLWRAIAGTSQQKVPGQEPSEAYPIISAYITSYAREYMRGIFRAMPEKTVLYTATDSIITTREGYDYLRARGQIDPVGLGSFKLVDGGLDCNISGPNYYRIGGRVCRGGLWAKAKHEAGRGWVADMWQRLPGIISSKPDGTILIKKVDLKPSQITQKGTIQPDGWVVPLWVPNNEELDWEWPKQRSELPDPRQDSPEP